MHLGLGVRYIVCRVQGVGFRVSSFGSRVSGLGSRVLSIAERGARSGFKLAGVGSQIQGSEARVAPGRGWRALRVEDLGCRVQGVRVLGVGSRLVHVFARPLLPDQELLDLARHDL